MPNAIVGYHVVADYTWTDPDTQLTYQHYTVTIDFTHGGGSIAVQANEYAAADDTKLGYDAGGITSKPGTDSIGLQLVGGLAHQQVYFKLFLFKPGKLVGKPPGQLKGEVIYDSLTTGTYSN